jgi:L-glutamine-phosphate cytidylyltransferase
VNIIKYIILGAGRGTRLHPLTLNQPKCLFNVDEDYTVAQRMIDLIHGCDNEAEIIFVVGFMSDVIKSKIKGCSFVYNPFYSITNSVASLWFAKEHLNSDVCIINGDIVTESALVQDIISNKDYDSCVLVDSSIRVGGDYNVQINSDRVVVMSKELTEYFGEYAGIVKLKQKDTKFLKKEIEAFINSGFSDQWYENVLVQMIFNNNFYLKYTDICNYAWTEVDCVDDLIKAKKIHKRDSIE